METAHQAFPPLDTAELASDDDEGQRSVLLAGQQSLLLARKVPTQAVDQAEVDHDQVTEEREHQAAYLREHDKLTDDHLDQFFKDQN